MTNEKWRRVSPKEAFEWCCSRTVTEEVIDYQIVTGAGWPYDEGSGVVLSDGSMVVATSQWSGPLSEVTPDCDAMPPEFWIFVPS